MKFPAPSVKKGGFALLLLGGLGTAVFLLNSDRKTTAGNSGVAENIVTIAGKPVSVVTVTTDERMKIKAARLGKTPSDQVWVQNEKADPKVGNPQEKLSYGNLVEIIRVARQEYDPKTHALLYRWLKSTEVDPSISKENLYRLKSRAMDAAVEQNPSMKEVLGVFSEVYFNAKQPEAVRDYIVQHLDSVYFRGANMASPLKEEWGTKAKAALIAPDAAPPLPKAMRTMLEHALNDSQSASIAGTALNTLIRWESQGLAFEGLDSVATAKEVLAKGNYPDSVRVVALQAAIRQPDKKTWAQARELAEPSHDTAVRVAAIGALGQSGDATLAPWLRELAKDENKFVQESANHALKMIEKQG
jgi:hypothetical protein